MAAVHPAVVTTQPQPSGDPYPEGQDSSSDCAEVDFSALHTSLLPALEVNRVDVDCSEASW